MEDTRLILMRAKARRFALQCKANPQNAFQIPDEIQEWLLVNEVPKFFELLKQFGLQRRLGTGIYWEKKQ